ncbi:hypothetical protein FACS189427_10750 [Planctomycetales bacterium]|nr:hypothetical protein FACS189427_10750 [Planctomycetales bacterium]
MIPLYLTLFFSEEDYKKAYEKYSTSNVCTHNERLRPDEVGLFSWLLEECQEKTDALSMIKDALQGNVD